MRSCMSCCLSQSITCIACNCFSSRRSSREQTESCFPGRILPFLTMPLVLSCILRRRSFPFSLSLGCWHSLPRPLRLHPLSLPLALHRSCIARSGVHVCESLMQRFLDQRRVCGRATAVAAAAAAALDECRCIPLLLMQVHASSISFSLSLEAQLGCRCRTPALHLMQAHLLACNALSLSLSQSSFAGPLGKGWKEVLSFPESFLPETRRC